MGSRVSITRVISRDLVGLEVLFYSRNLNKKMVKMKKNIESNKHLEEAQCFIRYGLGPVRRPGLPRWQPSIKCYLVVPYPRHAGKRRNAGFFKSIKEASGGRRYVYDKVKTRLALIRAYDYLKTVAEEDKTILFVGTGSNTSRIVGVSARRCRSSYIITKWLGGTLTNWEICRSRIRYLKSLILLEKTSEVWARQPKKETARRRRTLKKLLYKLGGLRNMERIPDCAIIVDPAYEHKAVLECIKLKIPIV